MTNNAARNAQTDGFYLYEEYGPELYGAGAASSTISGNQANYNATGFYDYYGYSNWMHNSAYRNGTYGFEFEEPSGTTIDSNSATLSGSDGFYVTSNSSGYEPRAFTNNSSTFNAGWGFYADYGMNGSGNTGGNTNSSGDCEDVAGCS